MALSGKFTNIGAVLERLDMLSEAGMDESSAALWIADVLYKMRGSIALQQVVTDGQNGPDPIRIENYKGELPCDLVEPQQFYEAGSLLPLRESGSPSHIMNFKKGPYKPDMWIKQTSENRVPISTLEIQTQPAKSVGKKSKGNTLAPNNTVSRGTNHLTQPKGGDLTFSLNKNYIFTGFEEGYVIAAYKGWPMDDAGNLMVPADPPVLNGMVAYLQERIDYRLWRRGMIADKIYTDSVQNRSWDVQAAVNHSVMPSLSQMESISNMLTQLIRKDHYFETHFTSLGRQENFRIQS